MSSYSIRSVEFVIRFKGAGGGGGGGLYGNFLKIDFLLVSDRGE